MQNPEHSNSVASQDAALSEKPFVIVLHERDRTSNGYFRPDAVVTISRALRTSGLLRALAPEDVKSLLLALTYVTANGWCRPTVQQIADAMRVSEAKAQARMKRLHEFHWLNQPLVTELPLDSGAIGYALSRTIVGIEQAPSEQLQPTPAPSPTAGREAVIAHSRARYAHTRADVERQIAEMMGWKEEGDGPEAKLRRRFLGTGLLREQIDLLIERYPRERIERQIDWLPYRNAKSPARYLLAAIENDYEAPVTVRLQQLHTQAVEHQETKHVANSDDNTSEIASDADRESPPLILPADEKTTHLE